MTCDKLETDEIEAYLAGTLGDADMTRVELHVFDCAACFDTLDVLRAARAALSADAPRRAAWWQSKAVALAASVAVVVALAGLVRYTRQATPVQVASQSAPSPTPVAPTAVAPPPAPVTGNSAAATPATVAPSAVPTNIPANPLRKLVTFEAPPVLALTLRSSDQRAEVSPAMSAALRAYVQGDFKAAFKGFSALETAERDLPAAQYFGGIAALKTGRSAEARRWLERASLADHPTTAVEAWFYLAYAHLQAGDGAAAIKALDTYIELDGDKVGAARTLRAEILASTSRR